MYTCLCGGRRPACTALLMRDRSQQRPRVTGRRCAAQLGAEHGLWSPLVNGCTAVDPAQRWPLDAVAWYLATYAAALCAPLPALQAQAATAWPCACPAAPVAAPRAALTAAAAAAFPIGTIGEGVSHSEPELPPPSRAPATAAPPNGQQGAPCSSGTGSSTSGGASSGTSGDASGGTSSDTSSSTGSSEGPGAFAAFVAECAGITAQRLIGGAGPGAGGLARAAGGDGGKAPAGAVVDVAARVGGPLAPRAQV